MAEEDIIYGKKRHMFGGIAPSNMIKLEMIDVSGEKYLDARLPKDTIVDGQTLCSVAGAVIRYKKATPPADEFDGTLVADITKDTLIDHSSTEVEGAGLGYYAAFPYSTQGVYNRNKSNVVCVDELPDLEIAFKTSYDPSINKYPSEITITFSEKYLSEYVNKLECGYFGPGRSDEKTITGLTALNNYVKDGVVTITMKEDFTDVGSVRCYARLIQDSVVITELQQDYSVVKYNYLFGYNIDLNDSDPDTRVYYPSDVENTYFKPAFMNYQTGKFDYGSWPSEPGEYFMPKPCMLSDTGIVAHYLDPNNYSLQEDGVTPSFVDNTKAAVQAMMEWGKIYTYREEVDGIYKFRCSDQPQTTEWKCWCNYDKNDNEIDHFYTSIYAGVNATPVEAGMNFRSRSGSSITMSDFCNEYTGYIGSTYQNKGWYIGYLSDHLLIQDLLVMIGRNTDCQTVFGYGCETGKHAKTGTLDNKGLFWGSASYEADLGVKVFGMEDYWGNSHRYVAGWLSSASKEYIKITWGTADGSTTTGFKYSSTSGYIKTSTNPSGGNHGYITGMETTPYGRIPITTSGGSATTYECDMFGWGAGSNSTYVHLIGYNSGNTSMGPFAAYPSPSTSAISYASASLSYKPVVE